VLQAYKFFRTEIARKVVGTSNAQLARFAHLYPLDPAILEQVIAHRLSVIAIETKNLDNTNAIFESLNAKGRPLTQLDLLRNYVFMTLGTRANSVLRSHWAPMEKIHLPERKDMESFVWADVVSRGTNVLQKRTYRSVQSEIREGGGDAGVAEAYVERLNRRAPVFAKIIDPGEEKHADLSKRLSRLDWSGGRTARPVVLWLYEEEHEGRCSMDDVARCVERLEGFVVRRFLNAMPPNNLNSMFGIMLSRLNNDEEYAPSTGSVEDRLIAVLLANPKEWPDDEVLTEGILKHDFYHNGDVRQRVHVLRSIDHSYGYTLSPGYEESDRSIEHILPQSRQSTGWVADLKSLGQEMSTVQERWLHVLGNLTIVAPADNSKLGDKRFADKAAIFATVDYKMTREVATLGALTGGERLWGGREIEARARALAAKCCALWKRPKAAFTAATSATGGDSEMNTEDEFDVEDEDLVPFTSSIAEEDLEGS